MVTLLCFVLVMSLAGGGAWTFIKQQQQLNSQHATATAQAASFAITTAAANTYNAAITSRGVRFSFKAQYARYNPYEWILSPSTVWHLVQAWTAQTDGQIHSSPAVANGVVYVSSQDDNLYVFHLWIYHLILP